MSRHGPIDLLMRALLLAVVGFVITSGSAFAHGGTARAFSDQSVAQTQTANEHKALDARVASSQVANAQLLATGTSRSGSEVADHSDGGPCSGHTPSGHASGDCCCKVACHSALTALTLEAAGTSDPLSHYVAGLSGMLVGQPGARTERPPRRA